MLELLAFLPLLFGMATELRGSGSKREPVTLYGWRDVFDEFRAQAHVGDSDAPFYEELFSSYPLWELREISPAFIQSYIEPGAIQRGFEDDRDEETVQRYMAILDDLPPIIVVPIGPGHGPYRWLHRDGQTRARAAYLLGIDVLAYVPVDRSDR